MEFLFIFLFILFLYLLFEMRFRKPDEMALFERKGEITLRKGKFYPRHFTLIIPTSVYSYNLEINSEAKGKLKIITKLMLTVAPNKNNLTALIKTGGWNNNVILNASKEINNQLNCFVQSYTERQDIDEISPENLTGYLKEKLSELGDKVGLNVVNIGVQTIEPENTDIADAIRERETARILEDTESIKQSSRITVSKSKTDAEEKISKFEHQLQLKKIELKKIEDEKEATLNSARVKEEIKNKKMQIDLEKEELKLLSNHPELLILSPQVTRLADASSNLKNAKTVVSLSGNEFSESSPLNTLLEQAVSKISNSLNNTKERK